MKILSGSMSIGSRSKDVIVYRRIIVVIVATAASWGSPGHAATSAPAVPMKTRPPLSDFTYGLASGPSWSTEYAVGSRLAAMAGLDQEAGPHGESGPKIASLTEASEDRNIDDLLTGSTTDLAILTVPTMERVARLRPGIRQRIAYVAPLYLEAIHVVARRDIADLAGLTGKRVFVGSEQGAGAALFEALGTAIRPVDLASGDGLDALTANTIDAAVFVSGKPVARLSALSASSGLHLLPIPYGAPLEKDFVPTTFAHADYPGLTEAGDLPSVAVPAVLTAYRWPPRSERAQTLGFLVATILDHLSKEGGDLPALQLKNVNWAATYPGWQRLDAATRWLKQHAPPQAPAAQAETLHLPPGGPTKDSQ